MFRIPFALAITLSVFALSAGQDRDDKKSKLPPLILVGSMDGQIEGVDTNGDRLVLNVKKVVREAVPVYGPQRLMNGRYQYVMKEKIVRETYNLSPDVKIRLMNRRPEPAKTGKKAVAGKDSKKDKDAATKETTEETSKDDKANAEKDEKPAKDLDASLGGVPGKKSDLAKGQIVKVALGRNNDRLNPQIYVMAVFVYADGK